jgi:predicted CopG family antitoxin
MNNKEFMEFIREYITRKKINVEDVIQIKETEDNNLVAEISEDFVSEFNSRVQADIEEVINNYIRYILESFKKD